VPQFSSPINLAAQNFQEPKFSRTGW